MARRYFHPQLVEGHKLALDAAVGRHLKQVMRARSGDEVRLFDGRGHEARARIVAVGGRGQPVEVEVLALEPAAREPAVTVHLACAVPHGSRGAWLFEHATEVGVRHVHPLRFERSRGTGDRATDRLARWRRIVVAAATQCDRGILPTVHPEQALADFLADATLPATRLLLQADAPPWRPPTLPPAAVLVMVGPEGGLSADEQHLAAAANFRVSGLGPLTLRTETAAVVAVATTVVTTLLAGDTDPPLTAPDG